MSLIHQLCSMIIPPIWCEVCMLLVILISLNFCLFILQCAFSTHYRVYIFFVYYIFRRSFTLFCHSFFILKFIVFPIVCHSGCSQICLFYMNFISIQIRFVLKNDDNKSLAIWNSSERDREIMCGNTFWILLIYLGLIYCIIHGLMIHDFNSKIY